jgi:hypothetical protein
MNDYYFTVDNGFACDVQRASNLGEALGPVQPVAGETFFLPRLRWT